MSVDHSHSAGDTESATAVKPSALETEPLMVLATATLLAHGIGAVVLLRRQERLAAFLMSVSGCSIAAGLMLARSRVTPIGNPRDPHGDPLTPLSLAGEEEPGARSAA